VRRRDGREDGTAAALGIRLIVLTPEDLPPRSPKLFRAEVATGI
jgi:hypothetical protein